MSTPPRSGAETTPTKFRRYEVKYVLEDGQAEEVISWAGANLKPDPHSAADASYRVASLYFDTFGFDVYHRRAGFSGVKYRVRRYGDEAIVWLERKRRSGTLVRKERAACSLDFRGRMWDHASDTDGFGHAFAAQIATLELHPTLLVTYHRRAWVLGDDARLTLDSRIRAGRPAEGRSFDADEVVPVDVASILELKYTENRPLGFDEAAALVGRDPTGFSKYAHGVEAAGLVKVVGRQLRTTGRGGVSVPLVSVPAGTRARSAEALDPSG